MDNERIVKQTIDTFGENCSPSFYIRQGIKRGQNELFSEILEDLPNIDNDLFEQYIKDRKEIRGDY